MKKRQSSEEIVIRAEIKTLVEEVANLKRMDLVQVWRDLKIHFKNSQSFADMPELIERKKLLEAWVVEGKAESEERKKHMWDIPEPTQREIDEKLAHKRWIEQRALDAANKKLRWFNEPHKGN